MFHTTEKSTVYAHSIRIPTLYTYICIPLMLLVLLHIRTCKHTVQTVHMVWCVMYVLSLCPDYMYVCIQLYTKNELCICTFAHTINCNIQAYKCTHSRVYFEELAQTQSREIRGLCHCVDSPACYNLYVAASHTTKCNRNSLFWWINIICSFRQ